MSYIVGSFLYLILMAIFISNIFYNIIMNYCLIFEYSILKHCLIFHYNILERLHNKNCQRN